MVHQAAEHDQRRRPSATDQAVTPSARPDRVSRLWVACAPTLRRRCIGVTVAVVTSGVFGLAAGWWTPRGPVTTSEALTTIGLSLLVGAVAGVGMRSRWALLLAPVTFAALFELARMGTDGPMVDGIHPRSMYGIVAFGLGRGIHALLALMPMLLGVTLGAVVARRLDRDRHLPSEPIRPGRRARHLIAALAILGLLTLTVALVRPARTNAIVGADGAPVAGSVAELTRVLIGGRGLALMIRGASATDPVLLFLAGGPGGTEMGAMRRHGQGLEQDFVVATLDQRGSGKSYDNLEPTSTLTLTQAISDTIEVTNYLRNRFHQDKIYVVGNSWGTILGVLAVQQHPELFHAFIGTGQMVSPRETDRIFYEDTLAWARRTNNAGLVDTLTASGPPPYRNILDYEPALTLIDKVHPYDHSRNDEGAGGNSENLFVEEYTLLEQVHNLAAWLDVFAVLYPQLQNIDFRTDATKLDVPVYLVQGRHELPGRAVLADQWFQLLDAPTKKLIVFDTAGHRALFEQPDRFHQVMTETVLRETEPNR
jgi:proline iminopeptidase